MTESRVVRRFFPTRRSSDLRLLTSKIARSSPGEPTLTWRASRLSRVPSHSGHGLELRYLASSSRTMSESVSRYRRSRLRSEEHTSELQSHHDLVCRLLLEKK